MDIKIRGLTPSEVQRLDELAQKHEMSREKYLRTMIRQVLVTDDVLEVEGRYVALINALSDRLDQANDIIERNTIVLKEITNAQTI